MKRIWGTWWLLLLLPIILAVDECPQTPLVPFFPPAVPTYEKVISVRGIEITFVFSEEDNMLVEISARDLNEGIWAYLTVSQNDGRILYQNMAPLLKRVSNSAKVTNGPKIGEEILISLRFVALPGFKKPEPFEGKYVLGEEKMK